MRQHQLVDAGIEEWGQGNGAYDRNTVLKVGDYRRIAAGELELIDRNSLRHALRRDATIGVHHLLHPLAAVAIVHIDAGFTGKIRDWADAPDVESADIVLAPHIKAIERRRNLT